MGNKVKALICMVVVFIMIFALVGCAEPAQTTPDNAAEPATADSEDTSAESTETEATGGYKIAFCDPTMSATWRVQMKAEFEYAAQQLKDAGVISEYYITVANDDPSKQISDVKDMITKGVDGIVIAASNPSALSPVVEEAMEAGIKVVSWNMLVDTDNVTSKIYQSDKEFGRVGAEFLAEKLGGKGKIIVLNGTAGNTVNAGRWEGAEEVFKKYPDIEILGTSYCDWEYGKGKAAVESLLSANPEIDGVWSQGGAMTQGAIDAFVAAGRPLVPMAGEAGNGFLRTWKQYIGVDNFDSIAPIYPPTMVLTALDTMIAALNGEQVEKIIEIPCNVITADTIDDYYRSDLSDAFWCDDTKLPDSVLASLFE
jgi:ribose transport system substrate-binding protein